VKIIVIPSIDLSNKKAVKRIKGERDSGLVLGNPIEIAIEMYQMGHTHVHIVDLDAAEEVGSNEEIIQELSKIGFRWIQVGGGIRDLSKAERLVKYSTAIILSTLPFSDREEYKRILRNIGGEKILVSIDYDENENVKIRGWKYSTLKVSQALEIIFEDDILGVIFTYIPNEGKRIGIDERIRIYNKRIKGIKEYAGGIRNVDDLLKLKSFGTNYAIVGMAYYTGELKGVKYV
jgi:phosphoribosylformimino-5-aminoimidazole carboxamide ribotide isomerase